MPAKNKIKEYFPSGYYHIYNRGVEKRTIFIDHQDEAVFLSYLKEYLSPKETDNLSNVIANADSSSKERAEAIKLLRMNNFADEIDLLAYCLMSNHFHLLIKQKNERGIEKFMRSFATRYVQYFNRRHEKRVGGLFQDTYKAVLVKSEEQLLHLSRYIHRNPVQKGLTLKECPQPSSYPNYLGQVRQVWIKPEEVLGYFARSGPNSYKEFVEGVKIEEQSVSLIKGLTIDL